MFRRHAKASDYGYREYEDIDVHDEFFEMISLRQIKEKSLEHTSMTGDQNATDSDIHLAFGTEPGEIIALEG